MFGKKKQLADTLPVTVHSIRGSEIFAAAAKLWSVNQRNVYADTQSRKEVLHFSIPSPHAVMWVQRDTGRQDCFELIICWPQEKGKPQLTDVYVILSGPEKTGDGAYAKQILEGLLSTPSTVPVNQPGGV
jgi:hypothetical protein